MGRRRFPFPRPAGPGRTDGCLTETIIYRPRSYLEPLPFEVLFPHAQPLEVELGAGDGSFILQWAALHPERNFLAVERLLGRLRKIEKKGTRAGLMNLRGLRIEAGYFTEYLLPPDSVTAFHIYFPDPWPKLRHRKNRLINSRFAAILRQKLCVGGTAYLRTDDLDYFEQMMTVFGACEQFAEVRTPAPLAEVTTDFEREFNARGIQTQRAAFRRTASP